VKNKRRRTTDLEKKTVEEEDVEESVVEGGVGTGGRQVLSVLEVTRKGKKGGDAK